jgi:hypothetical protein
VIELALLERVSTEMRNPPAEAGADAIARPGEALVSPASG